jgi:hypothetical protein
MESCDNEIVISIEPSESIQVVDLQPSTDVSTIGTIEDDPTLVVIGTQPDSAKTVCCDTPSTGGGSVDFATESLSAQILKIQAIAGEVISATKLVYMIDETTCGLSDKDILSKKDAIGIALNAALPGSSVDILLFGRFVDLFFTYPVNTSLYLGNNGNITDIAPSTGYSVLIGKGLGTGAIFIDIERPIIL